MKKLRWMVCVLSWVALSASAQFAQPFEWGHAVDGDLLTVEVEIPDAAYLYEDQTRVTLDPAMELVEQPVSVSHTDELGTFTVYEGGTTHRWVYRLDPSKPVQVSIAYQGCGQPAGGGGAVCYAPSSDLFTVGDVAAVVSATSDSAEFDATSLNAVLDQFELVRSDGGVMSVDEMLAFLNLEEEVSSSSSLLDGRSVWMLIVLVLVGGVALNLTPCVLPMIPINLAIIGAGAGASTKGQGFLRGGVYGLGIAVAYGGLGLFAVLTGSKFGTLNASPVFNFVIAVIFVVLGLAMFDVLQIDLSRFGSKFGVSEERRGRLLPAFAMGVVAALLAGACVAPIVIAVLLQGTTLYAAGHVAGLFLPLLLGVGMALPWPIAGAGLTALPKPGAWMVHVKHGFGMLIILMALYYAYLGVNLIPKSSDNAASSEGALIELEAQLQDALVDGRPVFIDFWAHWCKNCFKMEQTTFKDEAVIARLHEFNELKFQAEKLAHPGIKALLDRYNLPGLPGYVLLQKK